MQTTENDLLEIKHKLKTLLDKTEIKTNTLKQEELKGGLNKTGKMAQATEKTEKKAAKKKIRPMYSENVKKKCVELFKNENKTPQEIVDLLPTFFAGQKTPRIKAIKRYIRKIGGLKINGK